MSYSITSIELFVREMPPDRMPFSVGNAISAKKRRPRAVFLTRLQLKSGNNQCIGRSGDRPSFGWLDKRTHRSPDEKLADLILLLQKAREIWLEAGREFSSPFDLWQFCYQQIMDHAKAAGQEPLAASYATAMFERAVIDAVCRIKNRSFFDMVQRNGLGIEEGKIHPHLQGRDWTKTLPRKQRTRFFLRHTVGLSDPIDDSDLEKRIGDGEPETLEEYVKRDGLRYFKVKISSDADSNLDRLKRIWNILANHSDQAAVTLDGNEAYRDLGEFADFVSAFEKNLPGMFQHTLFIEQPLTRALTHDPATGDAVREIAKRKPLAIDEADGTVESFRSGFEIGYDGVSHKNCKGVFKSLLNRALCISFSESSGRDAFLSGEDLSNMAIAPLHQDFDTLSILDINHCERNGHHYQYGMSHLTAQEKETLRERHPDLYEEREGELFLRIEKGAVECRSIWESGFGGSTMPDWNSLTKLDDWKP